MAFGRDKKASSKAGARRTSVSTGHDSVDLRQLRRADLVELLVSDLDTIEELQEQLSSTTSELNETTAMANRLKDKLNEKDAQIEHLKDKLNEKDVTFDRLKKKLDDKDAQLERLKRRLDMKDEQIRSLTGMEPMRDPYLPFSQLVAATSTSVTPTVPVIPTTPATPVTPTTSVTQDHQPARRLVSSRPVAPAPAPTRDATVNPLERLWQDTSHLGHRSQEGKVTDRPQDSGRSSQSRSAVPPSPHQDLGTATPMGGTPSQRQRTGTQVPRRSQQDPHGTSSFRKVQDLGSIIETSTQGRQKISLGEGVRGDEPPIRDNPDDPSM